MIRTKLSDTPPEVSSEFSRSSQGGISICSWTKNECCKSTLHADHIPADGREWKSVLVSLIMMNDHSPSSRHLQRTNQRLGRVPCTGVYNCYQFITLISIGLTSEHFIQLIPDCGSPITTASGLCSKKSFILRSLLSASSGWNSPCTRCNRIVGGTITNAWRKQSRTWESSLYKCPGKYCIFKWKGTAANAFTEVGYVTGLKGEWNKTIGR
jgi:hypothetical protein